MSVDFKSALQGGTSPERPRTHAEINEYRRITLMEGAIISMAKHGVEGTTLKTICDAAGASRGLTGHYFDSKEVLIAEAFKHLFHSATESVAAEIERMAPKTKLERLRALPAALFSDKVFNPTSRDAFLSFWHEVRFNPLVKDANADLYEPYLGRVEKMFSEAAEEAGVSLDAQEAAVGLAALMDGFWLGMSIHNQSITHERSIALCHAYIGEHVSGKS